MCHECGVIVLDHTFWFQISCTCLSNSFSALTFSLVVRQTWCRQSGRSIKESEPGEKTDMWTAWWCVLLHCCLLIILLWTKHLNLFALGSISLRLCLATVCVNQALEIDMPFALMSTASIPACCGKVTRIRCSLWFCVGSLFQRAGHSQGQEVNDGVGSV